MIDEYLADVSAQVEFYYEDAHAAPGTAYELEVSDELDATDRP